MSSLEALRAVDQSGQLDDVLGLPEQLRDALWRVESAGLEPTEASGLIVCGMGGSAIGAVLARAALGDRLALPMLVFRDYELPSWTAPERAILCSSYSGDTEETLACFEAADAIGAKRYVATTGGALAKQAREAGVPVVGMPGGLQPRHAVGYTFTIACEIAAIVGAAPALRTEIDTAAAHLEEQRDALTARAAEIAAQVEGTIPLAYGCDLTVPVAYRWKCQVNENAKQHAFEHQLPELDHNELVGWSSEGGASGFSAIFLRDSDQHPRQRQRAELTAKLVAPTAHAVVEVETEGRTRVERLLWATMLGDLVSLHLAAARGVDPGPVEVIDRLKDELGRPCAADGTLPILAARDLAKVYGDGATAVRALDGVSIEVVRGEIVAIMGPSGSGKSTLLHLLGALESASAGEISLGDERYARLDDQGLTRVRRDRIGFVFQFFNLLPSLTAEENVVLPALIAGDRGEATAARARSLLERVGLRARADHLPSEMSGGEQQRVSIARALLRKPEIVLADEPTGNLDSRSSAEILALLRELSDAEQQTLVMVTHDPGAAAIADRVVFLRDGRVAGEIDGGSRERVAEAFARLE